MPSTPSPHDPTHTLPVKTRRLLDTTLSTRTYGHLLAPHVHGRTVSIMNQAAELTETVNKPLWETFDAAYDLLQNHYRNEYFYKNTILNHLNNKISDVGGWHRPDKSRRINILTEVRCNSSIIDMVVADADGVLDPAGTPSLTAIEIKTAYDSAARLQGQLSDYVGVATKIHVITDPAMRKTLTPYLMPGYGLSHLNHDAELINDVPAQPQHRVRNADRITALLWASELITLTERLTGTPIRVPNTRLRQAARDIVHSFPVHVIHLHAIDLIARRQPQSVLDITFDNVIPESMRALTTKQPLSAPAQARLHSRLRTPAAQL